MRSILLRQDYFTQVSQTLSDPTNIVQLLGGDASDVPAWLEGKLPEEIRQWLANMMLLKGVPFNYLVPDEAMLPMESIRFFRLDFNWLASLVDGAYSIGRSVGNDTLFDAAFAESVYAVVKSQAQITGDVVTGLLLRSAVVSGWWPGVKIDAFDSADDCPEVDPLPVLRYERLAPNVALCLFDGEVQRINIHEPPEGLHFGVLDTGDGAPICKEIKYTAVHEESDLDETQFLPTHLPDASAPPAEADVGEQVMQTDPDGGADKVPVTVPVPFRVGNLRVIKMSEMASALNTGLGVVPDGYLFTAAEFALQMVEGVQLVGFRRDD